MELTALRNELPEDMYPTDFNRFRSGVSVSQALADWQPVAAQVFTLFSVRIDGRTLSLRTTFRLIPNEWLRS